MQCFKFDVESVNNKDKAIKNLLILTAQPKHIHAKIVYGHAYCIFTTTGLHLFFCYYKHISHKMDTKCTDLHIAKIARLLPMWKNVVELLGLETQLVADIDGRYTDPEEQRSEALTRWVAKEGSKATYKKIYDVLCDLQHKEAAEKVQELTKGYTDLCKLFTSHGVQSCNEHTTVLAIVHIK